MAEIRINATGGVKLYDADDSHYAQIIAGTITSNVNAITLGHDVVSIVDNLALTSDSAVLKFGVDNDTTLTHTDGTGLTLNSTNKLCFNDVSQFIQGSSATVISIGATDEIDLTATAVDLNGTLDVSGATTTAAITASGIIKTDDTTAATSTTDGSLQTDGGLSVALDGVIGDDLLMLSDASVIHFGADSEVTLTHSADVGLNLKHTATADDKPVVLTLQTGETDMAANDVIGKIAFQAPDEGTGTDAILVAAAIQAVAEGNFSSSSNATSLQFMTGSSEAAAEQMRIDSAGRVQINNTDQNAYLQVFNSGGSTYTAYFRGNSTETVVLIRSNVDTGNNRTVDFTDSDSTLCGSINVNAGGNTVSYETSSDYRLKENVIDLTDAITRVKNLKPYRFNFKAKPDTTLDGFLAHEVQDVVPEAGSGTKDETEIKTNVIVNSKGNVEHEGITEEEWTQGKTDEKYESDTQWFASKEFIKPQGMDSSKLVPLLTSALQEAITKIETLEAKVTALEG